MIYPAELKILKDYSPLQPVSLYDYLIDFVISNPTNYPVTSWLMKSTVCTGSTMSEIFSRESVKEKIRNATSYINCNVLYYMISEKETGFNLLALSLVKRGYEITILQKEPVLLLNVFDPETSKWKLLLDQNLNDFLMYDVENSVDLLTDLRCNQYSSVMDLVQRSNIEVIYPQMSQEHSITDLEKFLAIINLMSYDDIFECHDCKKCTTSFCKTEEFFNHSSGSVFYKTSNYGYLSQYTVHEKKFAKLSKHIDKIPDSSINNIMMK